MTRYTGTKTVEAKPMTRGEYNEYRGWQIPQDENPADPGYLVEYQDGGKANDSRHQGYISWSPQGVFELSYKAIAPAVYAQPHQQRVFEEAAALNQNLSKLVAFTKTPMFDGLSLDDRVDLLDQESFMTGYLNVLTTRMAKFKA